MKRLGKQILYWCLAYRLAVQEAFGAKPHPFDVAVAQWLHRELWGEP